MKRSVKKTVMAGLASAALAASIVGITSTSASATDEVIPCPQQRHSEFLELNFHYTGNDPANSEWRCYANGGEFTLEHEVQLNELWTGNNHVQYFSGGQWLPAQPLAPNSDPTWAPGVGPTITKFRIV